MNKVLIINTTAAPMHFPIGRMGLVIPPGDGSMAQSAATNKNLITEAQWAAVLATKQGRALFDAGKLQGPAPEEVATVEPAASTAEILDETREKVAIAHAEQAQEEVTAVVSHRKKKYGKKNDDGDLDL